MKEKIDSARADGHHLATGHLAGPQPAGAVLRWWPRPPCCHWQPQWPLASAAAHYTVIATIPVGVDPDGVAVDPATRTAYVANAAYGQDSVSVIDEATNTVTATIPVGSQPYAVGVDPGSRIVYVANANSDSVSVIDAATNTVTVTISDVTPLENPNTFNGLFLQQMAVDPATGVVYVTDPSNDAVSVIDVATNTVTGSIPVGGDPQAMAVDPRTHAAYVANNSSGTVSVISAGLPTPVTTVSSSRNPSTVGQKVTFTATVDPAAQVR